MSAEYEANTVGRNGYDSPRGIVSLKSVTWVLNTRTTPGTPDGSDRFSTSFDPVPPVQAPTGAWCA